MRTQVQVRYWQAVAVMPWLCIHPGPAYGEALPTLSISDVTVSEASCNSQVATFTVSIGPPFGRNVTVQFASADGGAHAGTDYTAVSGTLMFARGSRSPQTITVPVADVLVPGPNKTFYVPPEQSGKCQDCARPGHCDHPGPHDSQMPELRLVLR